ncbi:MAG TPA: hypothetical protein VK211_20950 [Kamptonema sp.]|nr:hypothetical protein [Kamptonema sp.]
MSFQQNSLLFFATTLLVTLPTQSSFPFSITPPPPENYTYSRSYFQPVEEDVSVTGIVKLDAWPRNDPRRYPPFKGKVLPIRRGGTRGLLNLLTSQFPNWEFRPGRNIKGSFDIQQYYVCTPSFPAPDGQCGGNSGGVGTFFKLNYNPRPNSSDPVGVNIHWIQRVIDIYGGVEQDKIDIEPGQRDPFYDTNGNATPTYFRDVPWQSRFDINRTFYAETYIVKEIFDATVGDPNIVKRKVEIYNGVRWGFEHRATVITSCSGDSGGGGCTNRSLADTSTDGGMLFSENDDVGNEFFYSDDEFAALEMPPSEIDSNSDDALSAEEAPEPTTAFGALLALCGLSALKRLKKHKS